MFTLQVFNEGPGRPRETVTVGSLPEVAVRVPYLMAQHPEAARIVVSTSSTRLFQVDCRRPSGSAPEPAPARRLHVVN
jgi:hypothetical protein